MPRTADRQPDLSSRWCTVSQAAQALGVSRQRVLALIQAQALVAQRVGTVWLVSRASVWRRMNDGGRKKAHGGRRPRVVLLGTSPALRVSGAFHPTTWSVGIDARGGRKR